MRRRLLYGFLAVTLVGIVLQAAYMFYPAFRVGCDFSLRMYEVKCVLEHVDPFDVWSGRVHHPPYCSLGAAPNAGTGEIHAVNAYPPWAYTFALPLALLPVSVSGCLYFVFMLLSLLLLFLCAYERGLARFGSREKAVWAGAIPLFLLLPSIGSNFQSFNYPYLVLLATLGMVWCLERKHDVWGGVFWAIAMVKPQLAIIYAIPLLLRRRYKTCFVAAGLCVLASIPPAILVGRSPVVMMVESIKGSSAFFLGCGTFPYVISQWVGSGLDAVCGIAVGAAVCLWILVRHARNDGWFVQLAVAAAVSTLWSYSQLYNNVLMWPLFVLMAEAFLRAPQSRLVRVFAVLVLLFMTRIYTFAHGFAMLFPERLGYPYEWHGHLDSLNSFVTLCLIVAMFVSRECKSGLRSST